MKSMKKGGFKTDPLKSVAENGARDVDVRARKIYFLHRNVTNLPAYLQFDK